MVIWLFFITWGWGRWHLSEDHSENLFGRIGPVFWQLLKLQWHYYDLVSSANLFESSFSCVTLCPRAMSLSPTVLRVNSWLGEKEGVVRLTHCYCWVGFYHWFLVTFEEYKDREEVLRKSGMLRGSNISVTEDMSRWGRLWFVETILNSDLYSRRVREARTELRKFMRELKRTNPAATCHLQYDKLFVNHRWACHESWQCHEPRITGAMCGARPRPRWWSLVRSAAWVFSPSIKLTWTIAGWSWAARVPSCVTK